jgi:hypothetical protein
VRVKVQSLDEADAPAVGVRVLPDDGQEARQELVREDEEEDAGAPDRLGEVGHRHHVVGQPDPRKVLDVLVPRVDDVRELPGRAVLVAVDPDQLLVHPHVHPVLVVGQALAVGTDKSRDGAAPVPAPDDAHPVDLVGAVLGVRVDVHGGC